MRKILNNGEKTRQRKNKKRKKKKGGSKGCLQALLVTCMRHHACRTPKRPVANAFHNVIRTVEAMLQPTRGDRDRPKHQTWREWDGGWRAHTVERGLCGEGGERGGRELRHDVDVAGVAKQQLEGGLHVAARGDQSPHAGRVVAQPHVAKLLQLALICDSGVHQVGRQASSR